LRTLGSAGEDFVFGGEFFVENAEVCSAVASSIFEMAKPT